MTETRRLTKHERKMKSVQLFCLVLGAIVSFFVIIYSTIILQDYLVGGVGVALFSLVMKTFAPQKEDSKEGKSAPKEKQKNSLQKLNTVLDSFIFDLNQTKVRNIFMPTKNPPEKGFLEVLPNDSTKMLESISELKSSFPEVCSEAKILADKAIEIKDYWSPGNAPNLMKESLIPNYIKKLKKFQEKINTLSQ